MLVDSHVNLHAAAFDVDRAAVITRARAAGVGAMLTICDRLDRLPHVLAIAEAEIDIWCTAGVHPHEAKDYADLSAETLVQLCGHPRVVGVGECGLDFHYNWSPRETQRAVFAVHIAAAQRAGLPLVVHTREADADMMAMLGAAWEEGPLAVLLHCYTSGPELLRFAAERGAWFSVSGIAAFKTAEDVRERVRAMPGERILLETDCPYLAPPPHRGRRNEPAFLPRVAQALADVRGWTAEETAARTTAAFQALFPKAARTTS